MAEAAASLDGETPTAFEQETALAFWYFAKKGCELAILEAGLGGDMDATNIVTTTVCSIITSISMDHCRILGNKISEIAAHKAGIIKPGAPVICIEQKEDAMEPIVQQQKQQTRRFTRYTAMRCVRYFLISERALYFFENLRICI